MLTSRPGPEGKYAVYLGVAELEQSSGHPLLGAQTVYEPSNGPEGQQGRGKSSGENEWDFVKDQLSRQLKPPLRSPYQDQGFVFTVLRARERGRKGKEGRRGLVMVSSVSVDQSLHTKI